MMNNWKRSVYFIFILYLSMLKVELIAVILAFESLFLFF